MIWDGVFPEGSVPRVAGITAVVQSIDLQLVGANQNLQGTVTMVDGLGAPLANASVVVGEFVHGAYWRSNTGVSGADGSFTFVRLNPPGGMTTARVFIVSGLNTSWDGVTSVASVTK